MINKSVSSTFKNFDNIEGSKILKEEGINTYIPQINNYANYKKIRFNSKSKKKSIFDDILKPINYEQNIPVHNFFYKKNNRNNRINNKINDNSSDIEFNVKYDNIKRHVKNVKFINKNIFEKVLNKSYCNNLCILLNSNDKEYNIKRKFLGKLKPKYNENNLEYLTGINFFKNMERHKELKNLCNNSKNKNIISLKKKPSSYTDLKNYDSIDNSNNCGCDNNNKSFSKNIYFLINNRKNIEEYNKKLSLKFNKSEERKNENEILNKSDLISLNDHSLYNILKTRDKFYIKNKVENPLMKNISKEIDKTIDNLDNFSYNFSYNYNKNYNELYNYSNNINGKDMSNVENENTNDNNMSAINQKKISNPRLLYLLNSLNELNVMLMEAENTKKLFKKFKVLRNFKENFKKMDPINLFSYKRSNFFRYNLSNLYDDHRKFKKIKKKQNGNLRKTFLPFVILKNRIVFLENKKENEKNISDKKFNMNFSNKYTNIKDISSKSLLEDIKKEAEFENKIIKDISGNIRNRKKRDDKVIIKKAKSIK